MRRHSQTQFKSYYKDQQVAAENVNSITFYNQGDVTCIINNIVRIKPKMQVVIQQSDPDVIDDTDYYIVFDTTDADTTGTNQNLAVITINIKIKHE